MDNKSSKNLSRRDALKILAAAAGAVTLANLPSKWNTPELTAGVLPAHAQTSMALVCDPPFYLYIPPQYLPVYAYGYLGTTFPGVGANFEIDYELSASNGVHIISPLNGIAITDASGYARTPLTEVTVFTVPSTLTCTFSTGGLSCSAVVEFLDISTPGNNAGNKPFTGSWND